MIDWINLWFLKTINSHSFFSIKNSNNDFHQTFLLVTKTSSKNDCFFFVLLFSTNLYWHWLISLSQTSTNTYHTFFFFYFSFTHFSIIKIFNRSQLQLLKHNVLYVTKKETHMSKMFTNILFQSFNGSLWNN
jgi:hypothetical protein